MEGIRIVKTPIFSPSRRHRDEYDSDELNTRGAFNNSRMCAINASELVEPVGWYSGREYYVVTRGSSVGVFHNMGDVRSATKFPSSHWITCKTWNDAVKYWDTAYRNRNIFFLSEQARNAFTPRDRPDAGVSSTTSCNLQTSHTQPSTLKSTKGLPLAIEVSDSESEVEASRPQKIMKVYDRFELTTNEQKPYDATTRTCLDSSSTAGAVSLKSNFAHRKVQFDLTTPGASSSNPVCGKPKPKNPSIRSAKKIKSQTVHTENERGQ